jgi:hypothetical protein
LIRRESTGDAVFDFDRPDSGASIFDSHLAGQAGISFIQRAGLKV